MNGPVQLGLFGGSTTSAPAGAVSRVESNDVDLMHTIAANAVRCGYLLVGHAERVYSRADGRDGEVQRVPRYEEEAVHQLLRRRWLTTGADHHVTCGAAALTRTAVLVPKYTRTRITRWEQLQRPPSWPNPAGPPTRGPRPDPPSCLFCRDQGVIPDSGQARWSPDLGIHRPTTTSPCHHCQPSPGPVIPLDKRRKRP